MNPMRDDCDRLHSLDALRGVAALAVVFWHWQHFWLIEPRGPGADDGSFERSSQPSYEIFRVFYDHGWLAVDLFFSLSGFIFFWLYSQSISSQRLDSVRFFALRFSRLYPLHFATFLAVTVGQLIHIAIYERGFVYGNTDARHFLLNTFLLSSIGLEKGNSYNGPIWSVSVECLLYALFFLVCRLRLNKPILLLFISAIGFEIIYGYHSPVGRGVGSFFLGGFTCAIYQLIRRSSQVRILTIVIALVTSTLWLAGLAYVYLDSLFTNNSALMRIVTTLPSRGFAEIAVFPMTILSLALMETSFRVDFSGLNFLGNISYSSYLLHFPLQLGVALLFSHIGLGSEFFITNVSLLLFFVLLITTSAASFKYVEIPLQRNIRRRWLGATQRVAT